MTARTLYASLTPTLQRRFVVGLAREMYAGRISRDDATALLFELGATGVAA